tara:strand:+ start:477 stop:923 length:447 start_codon:yes stop_codon:yes gene_type:complete
VKIISHRAYVAGEDPHLENHPDAIQALLDTGLDVEIDVWLIDGVYYLGHDGPKYEIRENFLKQGALWCHAKNISALEQMLASDIHCFWHQEDDYTLTSRGYIWVYPGKETSGKNSVLVLPEKFPNIGWEKYDFICTDHVNDYLDKITT